MLRCSSWRRPGLLHQSVLEGVRGFGGHPAAENQLRRDQLIQRLAHLDRGPPRGSGEDVHREFPPDDRRDLCHVLDGRQPVQPRRERILEGRRNGQRR